MQGMASKRGEQWVMVQLVLLAAIVLLPFGAREVWSAPLAEVARLLGLLIGALGLLIVAVAALYLGSNLTIFPRPKPNGKLTQSGIYAVVRHPMYCGVILSALGWSLWQTSLLAILVSLALILFFDRKAAQEERWLQAQYPHYAEYRRRVKKLIPFIY